MSQRFGCNGNGLTTDLTTAKKEYKDLKDTWHDNEQVYEDDQINLVEIDVPEEVFEEFEDDSTTLKEEVLCIDPDDEDEDGYVSYYWYLKIEMEAGKKDEL